MNNTVVYILIIMLVLLLLAAIFIISFSNNSNTSEKWRGGGRRPWGWAGRPGRWGPGRWGPGRWSVGPGWGPRFGCSGLGCPYANIDCPDGQYYDSNLDKCIDKVIV